MKKIIIHCERKDGVSGESYALLCHGTEISQSRRSKMRWVMCRGMPICNRVEQMGSAGGGLYEGNLGTGSVKQR
jgi:hypothetical protein